MINNYDENKRVTIKIEKIMTKIEITIITIKN